MPICLVLHELGHAGPAAEQALFGAVFEVASSHWRVTPSATLVGTDVSPAYLRDHLLRALAEDARCEPVCLLCLEADPLHCHRALVAEAVAAAGGAAVVHLHAGAHDADLPRPP